MGKSIVMLLSLVLLAGCSGGNENAEKVSAKELEDIERRVWEDLLQECEELKKEGWEFCPKDRATTQDTRRLQTGSEIYREIIGKDPY